MDKRYQVFVSSTYEDLQEERLEVMKALLELECIPCGMEYFPAANEDQWTFIKKLIDNCDYYIVIIGGCYGSEDKQGISYTRKEYEYAISQRIPTIGFIIKERDILPPERKEKDKEKIHNLEDFIELVKTKLCKPWTTTHELGAVVSRSLTQLIKTTPRIGWVRADKVSNEELLIDLNRLRKENEVLKEENKQAITHNVTEISDIASLDEKIKVYGQYRSAYQSSGRSWSIEITWKDIFTLLSPHLLKFPNEEYVELILKKALFDKYGVSAYTSDLDDQIFLTIKVQLLALKLINVKYSATVVGGMAHFWSLTPEGVVLMFKLRTVKKSGYIIDKR